MKNKKEKILTCSCATDIVGEESTPGVLAQMLNVILHLQGPPHNMALPRHVKSLNDGEIFTDAYDHELKVLLEIKK